MSETVLCVCVCYLCGHMENSKYALDVHYYQKHRDALYPDYDDYLRTLDIKEKQNFV